MCAFSFVQWERKGGAFYPKCLGFVYVCVLFLFFWAVPRARKKSDFFTPFADTKNTTLFSLGTNRERERENVVFEEALS